MCVVAAGGSCAVLCCVDAIDLTKKPCKLTMANWSSPLRRLDASGEMLSC